MSTRTYIRQQMNRAILEENVHDSTKVQFSCAGNRSNFLNLGVRDLPYIIERLEELLETKLKQERELNAIISDDNGDILDKDYEISYRNAAIGDKELRVKVRACSFNVAEMKGRVYGEVTFCREL